MTSVSTHQNFLNTLGYNALILTLCIHYMELCIHYIFPSSLAKIGRERKKLKQEIKLSCG